MARCSPASRSCAACVRWTCSHRGRSRSGPTPRARSALPAVAPYVAATAPGLDGPGGAAPRRPPHRGGRRRRVGVADVTRGRDRGAQPALPPGRGPDRPGAHPDRHPRDRLDPRGGRLGGPRAARPARGRRGPLDTRDEAALADLRVELPAGGGRRRRASASSACATSGSSPTRTAARCATTALLWLTATSAGPGVLRHRAHQRVAPRPRHARGQPTRADLFFRRPDRPGVFGDHATHLVRTGDGWLVATSTWGDFETPTTRAGRRTPAGLRVTLAESGADLLRGATSSTPASCRCPPTASPPIATWDPHLVRRDGRWLVGFVSARRFFDFHPALAAGPTLDDLRLLGAATDRTATEGTTLVRGRRPDGRPRQRRARLPARAAAPASRSSTSTMTEIGHARRAVPDQPALADARAGRRQVAHGDLRRPRRRAASCSATAPTATSW